MNTTRSFVAKMAILLCAAAASLSCHKESTTQPNDFTPYERWTSLHLHNYTVDQMRVCYCPGSSQLVRVTVLADTLASALRLSDSTAMNKSLYRSIDSLFAKVFNPQGDSLIVRFNADYGYPESLDINPQQHPVDGGIIFQTSNLRAL